jgi:hypothetical protein
MKNKLSDLNNYLFEELERLMDDEVCKDTESTLREIDRSRAITDVAKTIVAAGHVQLDAIKTAGEWNLKNKQMPDLLASPATENILPETKQ